MSYQVSEWLWEQCRETVREKGHKSCDDCFERFKCWTASRPIVLGDTHIGLQNLQQGMKAQMITVNEVSEAFNKLSYQLRKAMTMKFDDEAIKCLTS